MMEAPPEDSVKSVAHRDRVSVWAWVLVTLVAAIVALSGIGSSKPLESHEVFVARTAQEMTDRGDWLVPYFNGVLRLKKPPLNYWLVIGVSQIIEPEGNVSEFSARLPSAIGGISLALMTMLLGVLLFDRDTALLGGLLVASCGGYMNYAHSARPEMVYAALCTAGLLGFCLAERWYGDGNGSGDRKSDRRSRLAAWCGWVAFGLAVLAKGPQLPVVLVIGWYASAAAGKDLRTALRATRVWSGMLIGLVLSSWWFIYIWFTIPEAQGIWRGETLDRYAGKDTAWWMLLNPYYFYRPAILVLPWVLLFPLALFIPLVRKIEHRQSAMRMWWLVVLGMFFLSFSFGRRWYYMLPLLAPLVLLMAASAVHVSMKCKAETIRLKLVRIVILHVQRRWIRILTLHVLGLTGYLVWSLVSNADRGGTLFTAILVGALGVATLAILARPLRDRIGTVGVTAALGCFAGLGFAAAQQSGVLLGGTLAERAVFTQLVVEVVAPTDQIVGGPGAWDQEIFTLRRPIAPIDRGSALVDILDTDGWTWLLVDTRSSTPVLPAGIEAEVMIRHEYDGRPDRLQLWRVERP